MSMRVSQQPRCPWLVLTLLVGLLGMHGLAGDHATMGSRSEPAVAAAHLPDHRLAAMDGAVAADDTTARPVAKASDERPTDHGGVERAELCLAVLLSALLVLAVSRRRVPARARLHAARLSAALTAEVPAPLLRPPDLVAGLCVSRT